MTRVPVTVITGMLGAGKTTLLRSLLTNTEGRQIAVIVNEFGEAGFDGTLLAQCVGKSCSADDIIELTNGCICCTVAEDFIPTMDKLLNRERKLDAIVIETSGLALPQPLLKAFAWPAVRMRATVDGVIAVVDSLALLDGRTETAAGRLQTAADHDDPVDEVFKDQLACADLVILSKTDLVPAQALDGIECRLAAGLRPSTRIVRARGDVAASVLIGLDMAVEDDLNGRAGQHGDDEHDHDDFDSIVVSAAPASDLAAIRERVAQALAVPGVLRVKGHASIAHKNAPVIVQGVGSRVDLSFSPPGSNPARQLVVIGLKGFSADRIRSALEN